MKKENCIEKFELNWPGKKQAFKQISKETKSTLCMHPDKSVNPGKTKNIFIEGDNLETLKLLQANYTKKIKLIYIDPPYNTSNNFVYTDNFKSKKNNEKLAIGSNPDEQINQNNIKSGSIHANWLSMIFPRLYLALNLLKDDGIILISIDHRENANLRLIMNSIYGEKNYVGEFVWLNRTTPNDAKKNFATDHEYILIYAKNAGLVNFEGIKKDLSKYKNKDQDPNGPWIADNPSAASGTESYRFPIKNPLSKEIYYPPAGRFWAFAPKRVQEWIKSGKMVFPKEKGKKFTLKKYLHELRSVKKPISSVIKQILTTKGTRELKNLFNSGSPFKYPKPVELIQLLLEQYTKNGDLVMDFFAGSGTTAHAVMKSNLETGQNKNFIIVQIPEEIQENNPAYREGYRFITDITKKRIDLVINKLEKGMNIKPKTQLGYDYFKIE